MNESANNVFIHQRAPAARTYRVCIRKLSLITPTGRTALVRPVGVYIAQICRNPENANGRGGLRYEKLHSHNAISAPIYPMDADHFSRPGRNSAHSICFQPRQERPSIFISELKDVFSNAHSLRLYRQAERYYKIACTLRYLPTAPDGTFLTDSSVQFLSSPSFFVGSVVPTFFLLAGSVRA